MNDQTLFVKLGTLSHNQSFSPRDFREYTGLSDSVLRRLRSLGLIRTVSRGQYYPTPAGWSAIEAAYK